MKTSVFKITRSILSIPIPNPDPSEAASRVDDGPAHCLYHDVSGTDRAPQSQLELPILRSRFDLEVSSCQILLIDVPQEAGKIAICRSGPLVGTSIAL